MTPSDPDDASVKVQGTVLCVLIIFGMLFYMKACPADKSETHFSSEASYFGIWMFIEVASS